MKQYSMFSLKLIYFEILLQIIFYHKNNEIVEYEIKKFLIKNLNNT